MSRGIKTKTRHGSYLLTEEEFEEFDKYAKGYGVKSKIIRKAILKYIEEQKKKGK